MSAIWSDLFALFPDTALEDDGEELAWGLVNLFHRAADKRSWQIDRATDEIRCLLASNDGSEVHSGQLETKIERARSAEAAMMALESCAFVLPMIAPRHKSESPGNPRRLT